MENKKWTTSKIVGSIAVVLLLVVAPAISYYYVSEGSKLRHARGVHPFEFRALDGTTFNSEIALKDKVYAASFVYTQGGELTDRVQHEMQKLQEKYASEQDFRLVTLTIDPERDSLPVYENFAAKYGADFTKWAFLYGAKDSITDQINGGFIGEVETENDLVADKKIVIVGKDGFIKGYYDVLEPKYLEKMIEMIDKQLSI